MAHLPLEIKDSPRYAYRGMMLDTNRRYFSVDAIKQFLDAMALAKLNVFHWHLLDDDSFPMELESYPSISKTGAFAANQVYTKQMMQDVVAYAQNLAIRVIPEFDNPGHARSVGLDPAFIDIIRCFSREMPNNVPDAYKINGGPPTGVLDPSKDLSYELVKGIFTDMNTIFPD